MTPENSVKLFDVIHRILTAIESVHFIGYYDNNYPEIKDSLK